MDPAPSSRAVSDDDTVIWRYMDLARFVWTLSTGGLWFAKATTLRDDPWEAFGKVERLSGQFAGGRPLRPRSCRDVASPALVRRRLRRTASGAMLRQRRGPAAQGSQSMEPQRDYPRWKYHPTKKAVVVNDAQAEAALGEGWGDTPT